jgi:predicted transcriptional regulator
MGGSNVSGVMVVLDVVNAINSSQADTKVDTYMSLDVLMTRIDDMTSLFNWILAGIFFIAGMLPVIAFFLEKGDK